MFAAIYPRKYENSPHSESAIGVRGVDQGRTTLFTAVITLACLPRAEDRPLAHQSPSYPLWLTYIFVEILITEKIKPIFILFLHLKLENWIDMFVQFSTISNQIYVHN